MLGTRRARRLFSTQSLFEAFLSSLIRGFRTALVPPRFACPNVLFVTLMLFRFSRIWSSFFERMSGPLPRHSLCSPPSLFFAQKVLFFEGFFSFPAVFPEGSFPPSHFFLLQVAFFPPRGFFPPVAESAALKRTLTGRGSQPQLIFFRSLFVFIFPHVRPILSTLFACLSSFFSGRGAFCQGTKTSRSESRPSFFLFFTCGFHEGPFFLAARGLSAGISPFLDSRRFSHSFSFFSCLVFSENSPPIFARFFCFFSRLSSLFAATFPWMSGQLFLRASPPLLTGRLLSGRARDQVFRGPSSYLFRRAPYLDRFPVSSAIFLGRFLEHTSRFFFSEARPSESSRSFPSKRGSLFSFSEKFRRSLPL